MTQGNSIEVGDTVGLKYRPEVPNAKVVSVADMGGGSSIVTLDAPLDGFKMWEPAQLVLVKKGKGA